MALNPNHSFEDLNDIKCSIIEKNCVQKRVDFLKKLLEFNGLTVIVVDSPPAKPVKVIPKTNEIESADADISTVSSTVEIIKTFTVGVTDVTFNPTNAIYNREIKTFSGETVTPNFWFQKDMPKNEGNWYWKK